MHVTGLYGGPRLLCISAAPPPGTLGGGHRENHVRVSVWESQMTRTDTPLFGTLYGSATLLCQIGDVAVS